MMTEQTAVSRETRVAAIADELGLDQPEITVLAGGLVNYTIRLRDASQDLVLRLAGAGTAELGADRHAELAMLQLAAAAGLAPQPVLMRPAEGLLVTRHVTGRVPGLDDARSPLMLARLGGWLARLHALPPPAGLAPIDIGARAAGYLRSLDAQDSLPLRRDLGQRLQRIRKELTPPPRFAACHHDLHHRNFVDTGTALIALDWEYAGPGDPVADLAGFVCYQDLDLEQTRVLLGGYGGDARRLAKRLAPLCWVFDCLCFGWMEIAAAQGLAVEPERRQRLVERLQG